jgi:peptide/nickel transport system permease protein
MLRIWRMSGKFRVGVTLIAIVVLAGLTQPLVNSLFFEGIDPLERGTFNIYLPISGEHLLGTDRLGRDNLALLILGIRYSLAVGVFAGLIATGIGIVVGFVAGYMGGIFDNVLRSFTDILLVIPTFPILVVLAVFVPRLDLPVMALLLAAFSWPSAARSIRAQVLSLRSRPYIDMARISMESDAEIIFRELVPNLLPYLGLGLASSIMSAMFAVVSLEVIGLAPGGIVSLGLMLSWALAWGVMAQAHLWHMILAPAGVLILLFVGLNLINIGMEEVYNPRLSAVTGR